MPWTPIKTGASTRSTHRHPLLQMLTPQVPRESTPLLLAAKSLPVIPVKRSIKEETLERLTKRRLLCAALISRAVSQHGATLQDPLTILSMPFSKQATLLDQVPSWHLAQNIASLAIGRALAESPDAAESLTIRWEDVLRAKDAQDAETRNMRKRLDSLGKKPVMPARRSTSKKSVPSKDPVIDGIRKSRDLSSHERRLLSCIVDTSKLAATTFADIHLPLKTIDAVRTVVSLPLLFPQAFQGGILRDHSTTGALLFGPPGTGKTLLARAVANESGARMLAIQVSLSDKPR